MITADLINNSRRMTVPRSLDLGPRQKAYITVAHTRSVVGVGARSAQTLLLNPVGDCKRSPLARSNINQSRAISS